MLRFSRLFGPGKQSSLPQIWKGVKKKRKKNSEEGSTNKFNFEQKQPSPPRPEDCESDDEVSNYLQFTYIMLFEKFLTKLFSYLFSFVEYLSFLNSLLLNIILHKVL